MTTLVAGDKIPDAEALDALPVGAAVTTLGGVKLLTRHPGAHGAKGGWASHVQNRELPSQEVWWRGMELVSLPGIVYDGPMVGDVITTVEQLDALPEAAVLVRQQGTETCSAWKIGPNTPEYAREGWDGMWYDNYHGRLDAEALIRHLAPYTVTVESLPVDLFETLDQFKWRFRDLALTGNERALGRSDSAQQILGTLGIEFTPSVGMRITNRHDRKELPENTRVYTGSPDDPKSFALFQKINDGWVKVFGEANTDPAQSVAVMVDALPVEGGLKTEPDEWFSKVASPEDAAQVRQLRRSGWMEGLKEKHAHGWCDEFERVMLRGGMSAELTKVQLPGGIKVGDSVSVEQARFLPVGSTFLFRDETGEVVGLYRRIEEATNKAGTQRVWARNGWEKKGQFQKQMTLVNDVLNQLGPADLLPLPDVAFQRSLPIGSRISPTGGGATYQKVVDDNTGTVPTWVECSRNREPTEPARHRDSAFWTGGTSQYGVTRFGPA